MPWEITGNAGINPATNFLGTTDNQALVVRTNGTEVMRLTASGNVGIGTTSPTNNLHIVGAAPADANAAQLRISANTTAGNFMLLGRAADYGFVQSHNSEPLALNPIGNNVGIGTTSPTERLTVDGNILATGDVILSGADCAEDFEIDESCLSTTEPGTVMVLDDEGRLRPSVTAYDKRVAGVVSGAGNCRPGIILDRQSDSIQRRPIALVGKVFCKVDATNDPVSVGDLLTTSSMPGHAMKATDPLQAFGTVLGKALAPLPEGHGLIPVLVSLH